MIIFLWGISFFFWRSSATRIRSWMIYRSNALGLFGSSALPPRAPVGRALRTMRSPQNSSVAKIFEEVKEKQTWMDSIGGRKLPTMLHHRLCYWSIVGLAHQGRVAPQTSFPWHRWLRIASISSVEAAGLEIWPSQSENWIWSFSFFFGYIFPRKHVSIYFSATHCLPANPSHWLCQFQGSSPALFFLGFWLYYIAQIMEVFAAYVATTC